MQVRCLLLLFPFAVAGLLAAPVKFTSGETRVHLIELYSSEGCSSCPPAEEWLGGLRTDPGLWRDFVPVAFPVDYWDRLGWRDRRARPEYTARQYAYAREWGGDGVYTPAFVLDGVEWQVRFARHLPPPSAEKAGRLSVEYAADGACRVAFAAAGDFEVHAVLLGGGISTAVRAGENEGRTLSHEFVALNLAAAALRDGTVELSLPRTPVAGVTRYALAVWVTRRGGLRPLQATGGWLE